MRWWPPWRRRVERRSSLFNLALDHDLLGTPTLSGVRVNSDQAQRLSSVWACVRLLSETVSTLPVDVFRVGDREPLPTPPLLVQPAAGMARHEWLEAAMRSLLLRGNVYGLVVDRGPDLRPLQIELLNPDTVAVRRLADGELEYRVAGHEVDPFDIWHVKAFVAAGMVHGLSPVEYARQGIGLGLAAENYASQWFGNGATPAGLLTTDADLTMEQAEALKFRWVNKIGATHGVAVLDRGARYQAISVAPEEAQFIETTKANVTTIARYYGVPPEMIGGEAGGHLTYANVEQRNLDFLTYVLNPWLVRLETALTALLPRPQYVKFNTGGLLRSNTKDRFAAYQIALASGFMTANEIRALEDLPELPGGDQLALPGGATPAPPPPEQVAA
jgi:HK97 family phage portal protein